MSAHPEGLGLTQSSTPIQGILDAGIDYTMTDDEQLIIERDRHRRQLDELTVNPGSFGRRRSTFFPALNVKSNELRTSSSSGPYLGAQRR
jgi:hypothetical protein